MRMDAKPKVSEANEVFSAFGHPHFGCPSEAKEIQSSRQKKSSANAEDFEFKGSKFKKFNALDGILKKSINH